MPATAAETAVDWSNRHAIDMARIEAGQVANVQALLTDLEAKLTTVLIKGDLKPGQADKLATIQKAAADAIGKTYQGIAGQMQMSLDGVAEMESKAGGKLLNAQVGADIFGPVLTEKQWSSVANKSLIFGHSSGDWWKSQDDALRFKFAGQMQEGYALGESVEDMVRRVRGTKKNGYTDGVMQTSRREAEALVRSSVQTISNSARLAGFESQGDIVKGVQWLSTLDRRTTSICMALNGLSWRFPDYEPIGHAKTFPGPTAHWNCFLEDTPVESAGSIQASYRRRYTGDIITLETHGGRRISATPNHPLLTDRGWIALKDLKQGDKLVAKPRRPAPSPGILPDDHQVVTFAQCHKATSELPGMLTMEVPISRPDFHGDAADNEVGEVATNCDLLTDNHPTRAKLSSKFFFQGTDLEMMVLPGDGSSPERLLITGASTDSSVSSSDRRLVTPSPAGIQILGTGASNARSDAPSPEACQRDPELTSNSPGGDCVFDVEFDRVSAILIRKAVAIWVHNLETETGFYFADGIASHNCRSAQVAVLRSWAELSGKPIKALDNQTMQQKLAAKLAKKGMAPEQAAKAMANAQASMDGQVSEAMDYQAWLAGKSDAFALDLLGPGRFAMWKSGKITTRDLTDQNNRPLTIAQLQAAIDGDGFPVETEGVEYLPPATPTPKFQADTLLADDTPKPTYKVEAIDSEKSQAVKAEFWNQQEKQPGKGTKNENAIGAAFESHSVHILRDDDGRIVAAIGWGKDQEDYSYLELQHVGSIAPGAGSQALKLAAAEAKARGKGIYLESLDADSSAFYAKWGFKIDTSQDMEPGDSDGNPWMMLKADEIPTLQAKLEQYMGTAPPAPTAGPDQAKAAATIADIIASPKGQTLKAAALAKLQKEQPGLTPSDMLAMAEGIAAEKQAAASKASKLSTAKAKLLAGKTPSPSEQATIDSLTPEEKTSWHESVKQAQTLASAPVVGLKVQVEESKLDKAKGLSALKKQPQIEGTEYEDWLDYLTPKELKGYKVNGLPIVEMTPEWEAGEVATLLDDTALAKLPNQLKSIPLAKAISNQVFIITADVEHYLTTGKTDSSNPAHMGKPPLVIKLGGQYQIHDGNHRANAYLFAGETEMPSLVYDLDAAIATDPKNPTVQKIFGGDPPADIVAMALQNHTVFTPSLPAASKATLAQAVASAGPDGDWVAAIFNSPAPTLDAKNAAKVLKAAKPYTYLTQETDFNPSAKIKPININAVGEYVNTSEPINLYLRGETAEFQAKYAHISKAKIEDQINKVSAAITEAGTKTKEWATFYRGVSHDQPDSYTQESFLSTTTDPAKAKEFAGLVKGKGGNVTKILVPPGTPYLGVDSYHINQGESEILFPKGATLVKIAPDTYLAITPGMENDPLVKAVYAAAQPPIAAATVPIPYWATQIPKTDGKAVMQTSKALTAKAGNPHLAAAIKAKLGFDPTIAGAKPGEVNAAIAGWAKTSGQDLGELLAEAKAEAKVAAKLASKTATSTAPDIKAKNLDLYVPDPGDLVKLKDLSGSTKPILAEDPATGKKWVVKSPDQGGGGPEHLKNEAAADAIYRIMGAPVPGSAFVEQSGKSYKVAEYLEGATNLGQWEATATAADKLAVHAKIQEHFVMDALMGNWDVAGQSNDNIMVMPDGTPVRVDNGGALDWRAMGSKKTAAEWKPEVTELKTLRDPSQAAGQTAQIFAGLTQGEIHNQIVAISAKRADLIEAVKSLKGDAVAEVFAKRIDYLEKQLPAAMRKASAAAKAANQTTAAAIPKAIAKDIQAARVNGVAIPVGTSQVEDMQALTWQEADTKGKPVTVTQLKVTAEGNEAIQAAIGKKLGLAPSVNATITSGAIPDPYYSAWVALAKTLNTHKDDGQFNAGTLANFATQYAALGDTVKVIEAKAIKTAADKAAIVQAKHYLAIGKQLEATKAAYVDAALKGTPVPATAPPMPFVTQEEFLVEDQKDDPNPTAKAKPTPIAADFTVTKTDKLKSNVATITNAQKSALSKTQESSVEAGVYTLQFPDGTTVVYIPRTGQTGSQGWKKGLAFEGSVQVRIPAEADHDAVMRTVETLQKIGIDPTPATADYRELVWLKKTAFVHNDHNALGQALAGKQDPAEQIKAARQFIESKYGVKVPQRGKPGYTADGEANSFGHGFKHVQRADLPAAVAEKELAGYTLMHRPGRAIEEVMEAFLNSGGEATATTGRVRKGIALGATGGMSATSDITSGGADFFFTRLRKKSDVAGSKITFKIRNISRADAVSYTGDNFGATGVRGTIRKSTVEEYKKIAANKTNDETIFKNGLFILDELDLIYCSSTGERDKVLQVFARHKITKLTDGRDVKSVVVVQ